MPKNSKPKETYRETYRADSNQVSRSVLANCRLPWLMPGWEVSSVELKAAGRLDNGEEFQEVRITLRESAANHTPEGSGLIETGAFGEEDDAQG